MEVYMTREIVLNHNEYVLLEILILVEHLTLDEEILKKVNNLKEEIYNRLFNQIKNSHLDIIDYDLIIKFYLEEFS